MSSLPPPPNLVGLELPAVFANNAMISRAVGGVKITFLEQVSEQATCARVAVYLPMQFAEEIARLLPDALARIKQLNEQPELQPQTWRM